MRDSKGRFLSNKNLQEKINCKFCLKEIEKYIYYKKGYSTRSFCDKACYYKYNSEHRKGVNNPMFGKKKTKEQIQKSVIKCSKELHPNWKGGITPLIVKIRASKEYNDWRTSVYKRDFYKCVECGNKKQIEAHHINSFSNIISYFNIKSFEDALHCFELWDINNGKTLCRDCHKLTY